MRSKTLWREPTEQNKLSRITETEDRISELEDKMVEINEAERKKEKRIEMRTTSETSETMSNAPTLESWEFQKKKTKRKAMRNTRGDNSWKLP